MSESEEEKRQKKLRRDREDKFADDESDYEDKPPRGRHEKRKRDQDDD